MVSNSDLQSWLFSRLVNPLFVIHRPLKPNSWSPINLPLWSSSHFEYHSKWQFHLSIAQFWNLSVITNRHFSLYPTRIVSHVSLILHTRCSLNLTSCLHLHGTNTVTPLAWTIGKDSYLEIFLKFPLYLAAWDWYHSSFSPTLKFPCAITSSSSSPG